MLRHHVPSSFDEEVVELSDGDHGLHPDELLLLVHEQDVRHVDANLKNNFQRFNPMLSSNDLTFYYIPSRESTYR